MKIFVYCKNLLNHIRIQKIGFKNQKPRRLYLIAQEDYRKAVAMSSDNRCLSVRHEDQQ